MKCGEAFNEYHSSHTTKQKAMAFHKIQNDFPLLDVKDSLNIRWVFESGWVGAAPPLTGGGLHRGTDFGWPKAGLEFL